MSPFLHGPATYELWFDAPRDGAHLAIDMYVEQHGDRTFTARFAGTRAPLTDRALAAAAVRYPLMTAQVIGADPLRGAQAASARARRTDGRGGIIGR